MSKLVTNDNLKAYHAELAEHIKLLQRNTAYILDDIVNYDGITLKCTTAGTTNTTKPNISALAVGSTYTDGTCVWTRVDLNKRGIDYYESAKDYVVDDQVVYDNKIYKCITAHTSTSTFDTTKWAEISAGGGGGIAEYTTGTSYSSGDLVIKDNVLYKANTTTSTTWVESEWDVIETSFNTTSTYAQKIVTNVVAPYEMLLQVGDSNYCKPPIDVLKKTGGSDNVTLTLENYNNALAYTGTSDFLKIENSKAKLYNYKEYPITTQTLSTIDIGVSDEVDFGDFVDISTYPDEHTKLLLQFNGTIEDITGNIPLASLVTGGTVSYDDGKFNSCFSTGYLRCNDTINMWQFGSSNFTIDYWGKTNGTPSGTFSGYNGPEIAFTSTDRTNSASEYRLNASPNFIRINGTVLYDNNIGQTLSVGFHHFALVRNENTFYYFIDGELITSFEYANAVNNYSWMNINFEPWYYDERHQHIDEFRISDIARWTDEFTPPSQPYYNHQYNITSLEMN